ncbi:hypothetical protein R1flu_023588 [Riccia fluitans]|uniref:Proteasome adapter and scaffold protein ECM29 HEAT-repeat domain-containing protein n=1 Tax=Riccia fluitans TaxID=41844 RepID=A0ABD1XVG0_9MARC
MQLVRYQYDPNKRIPDIIQGRKYSEVGKYLERIWTMAFRAIDDIKETVRLGGESLCRARVVSNPTSQMSDLVYCMLESLSSLEDQRLNYAELHAERAGISTEKLENLRVAVAKDSPISGVGLNARVGVAKFISQLAQRVGSDIRPQWNPSEVFIRGREANEILKGHLPRPSRLCFYSQMILISVPSVNVGIQRGPSVLVWPQKKKTAKATAYMAGRRLENHKHKCPSAFDRSAGGTTGSSLGRVTSYIGPMDKYVVAFTQYQCRIMTRESARIMLPAPVEDDVHTEPNEPKEMAPPYEKMLSCLAAALEVASPASTLAMGKQVTTALVATLGQGHLWPVKLSSLSTIKVFLGRLKVIFSMENNDLEQNYLCVKPWLEELIPFGDSVTEVKVLQVHTAALESLVEILEVGTLGSDIRQNPFRHRGEKTARCSSCGKECCSEGSNRRRNEWDVGSRMIYSPSDARIG